HFCPGQHMARHQAKAQPPDRRANQRPPPDARKRRGIPQKQLRHAPAGGHHFSTRKLPITRASIPELQKERIPSVGVGTMASPRTLKEVFMTTGTPVRLPNSSISRQYSGLISFSTVCGRALPSTCVTEGITLRFSDFTSAVKIINGESVALSRYSAAAS